MKQFFYKGLCFFFFILLSGCATDKFLYSDRDLSQETWQNNVVTNSSHWDEGADHWFFTGRPNATEKMNRKAPDSATMSTTVVRVSDFTDIKTNGAFQVQIFGTDERNSVVIFGPNAGVNAVSIKIVGQTLYVRQTNDQLPNSFMNGIIVRIGVNRLNKLVTRGCGSVEGISLRSHHLEVIGKGGGHVYLNGQINLSKVSQYGTGKITIFGVDSPQLDIHTTNSGSVNITGNVGVRCINHYGQNNITIVGANSHSLDINAYGAGKISISGTVNLRHLNAKDQVCVYILHAHSQRIEANVLDNARVGIRGVTKELYVNTFNQAIFWGRYLCAGNSYAKACHQSHMNIAACGKVFASASDTASIYYFGPANLLSSFTSGQGRVMPMGDQTWCTNRSEFRSYSYTNAHKEEAVAVYQEVDLSAPRRHPHHHRNLPSQYIK